MSEKPFDSSHDFHHIERVLALTETLAASENSLHPETQLDPLLITLTAILHDVGDSKYVLKPTEVDGVKMPAPTTESILLAHFAPVALASTVQLLTTNVSCSKEQKRPEEMKKLIAQYPELAIVQDADRLDALGAVGVARAFVFNGVRGEPLAKARSVFDTRLLPREKMMRTALGQKMAKERCDFLRAFMVNWDLERGGYELQFEQRQKVAELEKTKQL
ncbi:hypothetical protein K431DRAFT_220169 [Polychaeton citri CBS 116435]|uniref:HD/PDEase domain-containing protein n=1 Tax=Polychaeton citri CBS 116435 TaxID=1314669 RepID=A0A9P4QEP2_9PEZI|nr:hypothetical protein K431DRAFT_220169 [Polychaeton citri CBS 116435]